MAIVLFLAIHPEEQAPALRHRGWMACHLTSDGVTAPPVNFPRDAMLVVDDSTSPRHADPAAVAATVTRIPCDGILLDFQKPDNPLTAEIAAAIREKALIKVGISEPYAKNLDCAVFLPPIPPNRPPESYLRPWQGREIWLDMAPSPTRINITESGSRQCPLSAVPRWENCHADEELFCHYHIQAEQNQIAFDLWRTHRDIWELLQATEAMGVTRGIGLYQELENLEGI